jgi:hypothetical protein
MSRDVHRLVSTLLIALFAATTLACSDNGPASRPLDDHGDAEFSRPGIPSFQSGQGGGSNSDAGADDSGDAEDVSDSSDAGEQSGSLNCSGGVECLKTCGRERFDCLDVCDSVACRDDCEIQFMICRAYCNDRVTGDERGVFEQYQLCLAETCDFHEFEVDWTECVTELCDFIASDCP